jgi:hypothetical protein
MDTLWCIVPFVGVIALGLYGVFYKLGETVAIVRLLRNPPDREIEIQPVVNLGFFIWPKPFTYTPPPLVADDRKGEEEIKVLGFVKGKAKIKPGPKDKPDDMKLRLVLGWLKEQDTITQEGYCKREGISPSTLRKWRKELEEQGKLNSSEL